MKIQKWLTFVLVMLLGLFVVACSTPEPVDEEPVAETDDSQEEAPEVEEEPEVESEAGDAVDDVSAEADVADVAGFRVAIVMPSTITDLAWSQSLYDALVRLQEQAGGEDNFEIAYSESMFNVTDAASAIRDYAEDSYDLVLAHGTQYGTSLFEIAPDYPDTSFAWGTATDTGQEDGLDNVFAYEARAEEGGFAAGVLAGNLTESGVIGVVGPVEAGDAKLYIDGFVAGVGFANPEADVNVSYTGSFGDTALAAEAANTHISAGADVLTGSAQQVVGAIGVAAEAGIPWIGTQADQSSIAPDTVIATQLYVWDGVLSDMINKHEAGTMGGTAYALTLSNGGLVMDYAGGLAAEPVKAAQDAASQIAAGNLDPMNAPAMDDGAMEEDGGEMMDEDGESLAGIDGMRVAVVMPSTTTDLAWSQAVYDSLLRLQAEAGGDNVFEIAFSESMFNVTDAASAIRDYAEDDYDLVIAHGTQYGTSLFEIAPDYPETSFAYGTATDTGEADGIDNIFAYEARAEEGGYVAGVLAAALSESGVIGVVGPVEAGDAKLYIDGFVAGVASANPDAQVNVSYTGSFGDTALAAEAANTHISAGADVLTGSAQQVVGAIGVASEQGIPWIGTQADQSPIDADIVAASQIYDWDDVLRDMIMKHLAGEYGGTAYALTLENGGLYMQYQDGLDGAAVDAAEETADEIRSGGLDVMSELE